ncbi:MAG TPA: hypothetical protein VFG42_23855 [Baekduia sp.]|uniref:hypothetical protein n=1 Tax=Baekduia sp. TaxID=2600305 RepID=UPI002D78F726|nr:hypothetical protein [Baekduia sp.]HET6509850.1 hypothetical protein [Baekduia sp.]
MTPTSTIVIQEAAAAHEAALRDLAQLDSARPLTRPALMATVDGRLVAAASLHDGRVVADPFAESEQAVRLLRLHVAEIDGRRRTHPRRRRPRLALRPRAAV